MANTYSTDLELSSSQYWSIASPSNLNFTTTVSWEFWIKFEQLPSTAGSNFTVYERRDGDDGIRISFQSSGDIFRLVTVNSNTIDQYNTDAAGVVSGDVGEWVHYSITYDNGTAVMRKNGTALDHTRSGTGVAIGVPSAPMQIGAKYNGGVAQYFDGKIDEFRIWSDVRTQSEIDDNMSVELNGDEAGLVTYYKFNNDGLDETSSNNDLTNNNSCTFTTDVPFVGTSAALTGTVTASIDESDIVTGGKTIILGLTGDEWVADGADFNAQKQNIIDGLTSAQSEGTGWNAEVKANLSTASTIRTNDSTCTITLEAASGYDITAQETITVTIPATALTTSTSAIVASPTFTVDPVAVGAAILNLNTGFWGTN